MARAASDEATRLKAARARSTDDKARPGGRDKTRPKSLPAELARRGKKSRPRQRRRGPPAKKPGGRSRRTNEALMSKARPYARRKATPRSSRLNWRQLGRKLRPRQRRRGLRARRRPGRWPRRANEAPTIKARPYARRQGNAEKLATELAAARREIQSQVSVASSARDQAAGANVATERSADEQRRALQQERDKTEKLATELAEATLSLEAQAKAKAADEAVRDNHLATFRGELQKAKAEATAARVSLVAGRPRTQRIEQQLASIQETTAPPGSRSPAAASSGVGQP